MIIPMRGGFQLSPLNQSSVYFSNNQFAKESQGLRCFGFPCGYSVRRCLRSRTESRNRNTAYTMRRPNQIYSAEYPAS